MGQLRESPYAPIRQIKNEPVVGLHDNMTF
jgi:hypothetical protein